MKNEGLLSKAMYFIYMFNDPDDVHYVGHYFNFRSEFDSGVCLFDTIEDAKTHADAFTLLNESYTNICVNKVVAHFDPQFFPVLLKGKP